MGKDEHCPYYYIDEICKIIHQWKLEAGVDTAVIIKYDYRKKKMMIFTTKPGYLIGKAGALRMKYSSLLLPRLVSKFTDQDGVAELDDYIKIIECDDVIE
jgi:ribosomal protein S3